MLSIKYLFRYFIDNETFHIIVARINFISKIEQIMFLNCDKNVYWKNDRKYAILIVIIILIIIKGE